MNENQTEFYQLVSRVKHMFQTVQKAWYDGEKIGEKIGGRRIYSCRKTEEREALLDPNKGSATKIERYDFSLNHKIWIGTPCDFEMSLQPSVTMRPQRLICNVPCPGFITFLTIQVANVALTVGNATDAWAYNAQAVGSHLDAPTMSPANRARLVGNYSGLCPSGRPIQLGAKVRKAIEQMQASHKQTVHKPKSSKTFVRKARTPDFPIDFSVFDDLAPEGPYPVGSLFLVCATFQGPAIIIA